MLRMRILETERLVLRPFCQDDLRDINTWEEASGERYTELQAQSLLDFCHRGGLAKNSYFRLHSSLLVTGIFLSNWAFCSKKTQDKAEKNPQNDKDQNDGTKRKGMQPRGTFSTDTGVYASEHGHRLASD